MQSLLRPLSPCAPALAAYQLVIGPSPPQPLAGGALPLPHHGQKGGFQARASSLHLPSLHTREVDHLLQLPPNGQGHLAALYTFTPPSCDASASAALLVT